MQDRRHRATLRTQPYGQGSLLLRERRPSSTEPDDDNPFAPPPADRPEQPWQPRHPQHPAGGEGSGGGDGSSDGGEGDGSSPGRGSQWSPVQPGRHDGGFGAGPQRPAGGPNDPGNGRNGGQGGPGPTLRWDPKDPAQRRARYALLAGMWAFFFALFNLPEIGLLLGALAVYWGVSALRAKPQPDSGAAKGSTASGTSEPPASPTSPSSPTSPTSPTDGPPPGPGVPPAPTAPPAPGPYAGPYAGATAASSKQQITAAVSGLVTAGLALLIVILTFSAQLVYRDYYTCVDDALTKQGQIACNTKLPHSLVPVLGTKK
ncbi:hypothetical protein G3I19_17650 [Streptomyces sp. SID10853]|uniref:hypothetical protein n=1 Tax=Streptomyces sp. SID10853 TaxID=2706028 RepID=UPI0013C21C2F|nr:hypothetical protein [Streptomyces sp. SID10853]NDZ80316.1 hypothetical protein [Streptomyces sp. SID10853]